MAKVLVVDDAVFMRIKASKLLSEQGYSVVEAASGEEALEAYIRERPDVVLMDITMPGMDGIAALKKILAEHPDARVIMCTALGQRSMVLEAIKSGAKDFVVKPFEPDQLLAAVKKQIGSQ